ncbi:MAG: gliding motility-associated C-terminal domain-containing protein [Bacteroidales bacterium]|nr:gliding motility-associated C-terminal domain-containing protein [Bacteroidales bacterium]
MNRKRAKYLLALILCLAVQQVYPQSYTPISGVINKYTSITAIQSSQGFDSDTVTVTSVADFAVDDTVMIYCAKGARIGTGDPAYLPGDELYRPGWDAQNPGNAGRYAFYRIETMIGNNVVLNAALNPEILPLGPGEVAQLIRVRSYRYAQVPPAGLSADPWDPGTGTGGVVALFVHGILRLDGDIDVSGRGFRGAPGSSDADYTAGCLDGDTMSYFYLDGERWAGLKGEGITDTRFLYNRGKGSNINGGGGGNGLLAGGGGGSNYSAGVRGGEQSTACTPGDSLTGGGGGFDLGRSGYYYVNKNGTPQIDHAADRIFFGGGGGSGSKPAGAGTTDGGHGGGIVVIVADTILGNGGGIYANGGDVVGTAANGAGAGGGGGGCIILDVAGYRGTIPLSAVGGDGGNSSSTGSDTTGMGGAGGGGIYWHSGSVNPPEFQASFSAGNNGVFESLPDYAPLASPNPPVRKDELVAPLRGFLFNPVPSEFWICGDQDPEPIIAAEPRGGDGTYTYQWIDSSSTQNFWADIALANGKDYDPGPLSDTTYFRRIVTSLGLSDTSFRIAVYVHPEITGNTIAASDTVCSGNPPELFASGATIGGGPTVGTFTYKWQHLPDGAGSYSDLTAAVAEPTYQAGALFTSTDYRRIAYAGVCVDTSNEESVRVLEALTGNVITPNDTICVNTVPDLISGPAPSDGDQDDLRYRWLSSASPGVMGSPIAGETGLSYQSPALSQTTYIRRVVLSGNDDACRDTSAYVEILNVPAINGNSIASPQTVCQEDRPDPLTGSSPGGGYLGQYSYTWIASTDLASWAPATGGGSNGVASNFDPGVMSGDTTWYRRVVGSGGLQLACKDTSSAIVINVLPSITNNVVTPVDDIKCQWDVPEAIIGSLPGGGATVAGNDPTREYRWEVSVMELEPGVGDWTPVASGSTGQSYTDPDQLTSDVNRWYHRIVISGPEGQCRDTSNRVHLDIHSAITANAIDAAQAICFNDSKALRHESLAGGEVGFTPIYTWRSWLEGESVADAVPLAGSDQQEFVGGPYSDPATLTYFYDRVVEIGSCRDTSASMMVTVMQLPGGELTDAAFFACEKDTALQLDLNMGSLSVGHYVTPWLVYLKDGVHTGIGPGLVDQDMDVVNITMDTEGADHISYTYEIESILYYPEDGYACTAPAANLPLSPVEVSLARMPDPQILVDGVARDSYKVCSDTATLRLDPDNGNSSRWSVPAGALLFTPGSGQDEYIVSIPDRHEDYGEYRIFIRSEAGDCAGLDSMDLHFFEQPAPAYAGPDTVLFLVNAVQLRADPPTAGTGTWALTNGSGIIAEEHNPGTFAYELGLGEENTFRWTVRNGEDEGMCTTSSDVTIVHRNEVKKYQGFSPNGDMSNEYYIIQGLPYADEFSVSFFNSLGNTVRTVTNENMDEMEIDESLIAHGLREDEMVVWDGRSNNGNMVPSGTYYFVVTFIMHQRDYLSGEIDRTDSYEFKGYVVVVRE